MYTPITEHLLCAYCLFYDWKFNVELYLKASESTFLQADGEVGTETRENQEP